jgi:hypothetical protein
MVKNFLVIPLVLLLSVQKPVKKPDVHSDFQFGSYPLSRIADAMMKDDLTRQIVVAYSQGWSSDKIAKTLKASPADVSRISDKLEDERLVGRQDEYDISAFMPVIRERDFERMREPCGVTHGNSPGCWPITGRTSRRWSFARRHEDHP